MKTSDLMAGFSTPFGNATDQKAGLVRLATKNEAVQGAMQNVAAPPQIDYLLNPYRNLAVNGAFDIATKGTLITGVSTSIGSTLDGWRLNTNSTWVCDISQSNGGRLCNTNMGHNLSIKVTTAHSNVLADDFLVLVHRLESCIIQPIVYKPFSVSFNVFASKPGTAYFALRNLDYTKSYVVPITIDTANTWKHIKIEQIPPLLGNAYSTFFPNTDTGIRNTISVACGTNKRTNAVNQWIDGNYIAGPNQSNFGSNTNDTFKITDFQIEANPYCTPFEVKHPAIEKMLCERYVEEIQIPNKHFPVFTTTSGVDSYSYRTFKRAAPSIYIVPNSFNWYRAGIDWLPFNTYLMQTNYSPNTILFIGMGRLATETVKFQPGIDHTYQIYAWVDCTL